MNCKTCDKAPEDHDFPAPSGWFVSFRGFPFEAWYCEDHAMDAMPKLPEVRSDFEGRVRVPGVNTGEGFDHQRQRALLGKELPVVRELAGKDIVWPEKWTMPIGKRGRAPTVESLNDPGRRREFMRLNTRFQEM